MKANLERPDPVWGKSYSLFGDQDNTDAYFRTISRLTDEFCRYSESPEKLLEQVRRAAKDRIFRRLLQTGIGRPVLNGRFEPLIRNQLARYTTSVAGHLRMLPLLRRFNPVLAASERQYHLYMLEVELTNRMNGPAFREAPFKLAFLPHCLRDLSRTCRSAVEGIDYRCRACSLDCYLNHASRLLAGYGAEAYIWKEADLHRLFRNLKSEGKAPGILGIACFPELVRGMRLCARHGLPVVGLPLNANRCARWTGVFHPNSINLRQLKKLLDSEDVVR